MKDILNHWWINLGYKETPCGQSYPNPEMLKAVRSNASLSSDSEGESEFKAQPLKGILKKPKTSDTYCEDFSDECASTENNLRHKSPQVLSDSHSNGEFCNASNGSYRNSDTCNHNNTRDSGVPQSPVEDAAEVFRCSVDDQKSGEEIKDISAMSEDDTKKVFDSEDDSKKVFDSNKKPARGILKRRGKFSGGDSGCVLNESGNKSPASDTKENNKMLYNLSDIESALCEEGNDSHSSQICRNDASDFVCSATVNQTPSADNSNVTVVPRRSILKKPADPKKRLSACSTGSNSSADILDFSYDSDDNFMNLAKYDINRNGNSISMETNGATTNFGPVKVTEPPRERRKPRPFTSVFKNGDAISGQIDHDELREIYKQALEYCQKQ